MTIGGYTISNEALMNVVVLIGLVITISVTAISVITGVINGISMCIKISKGVPIEEVISEDKERVERQREKERIKFQSKIYVLTHPIEYINGQYFSRLDGILKNESGAKNNG